VGTVRQGKGWDIQKAYLHGVVLGPRIDQSWTSLDAVRPEDVE
jgi:hypothetical protein